MIAIYYMNVGRFLIFIEIHAATFGTVKDTLCLIVSLGTVNEVELNSLILGYSTS